MRVFFLALSLFLLGWVVFNKQELPPDEVGDWVEAENILGEASARTCPGISFLDVLLDKNTAVPVDYVPLDLVSVEGQRLRSETANQYLLMKEVAKQSGLGFKIYSGFRAAADQSVLVAKWAGKRAAPPGHSEHQLGTAMDLTVKYPSAAWNWLDQNAHKFGFVMSYRGTQQNQTKYDFEPWHWRFVGIALATKIRQSPASPQSFYRKIVCS